jgi:hypothetical protein
MISKWSATTGRKDWATPGVLANLLHRYNTLPHGTTGVEPALARHAINDPELLAYIQEKNKRAAKKSMGIDGSLLEKGQRMRLAVTAISSEARKDDKSYAGRKSSELTNYSRRIFTVRSRSKGTELMFPQYRLEEFKNAAIFWRYELLPVDESQLRKDMAPLKPKDKLERLEREAVEKLTSAESSSTTSNNNTATAGQDTTRRFIGMAVEKQFVDSPDGRPVQGAVVGHRPAAADETKAETWVVEYMQPGKKGVREEVTPQELLDMLKGDSGNLADADEDPKTDKPEKQGGSSSSSSGSTDPLIGRQVGNVEDDDIGVIIDVKFRKYNGKKRKRAIVKWNTPLEKADGSLTYTKQYFVSDLKPLLLPL